MACKCRSADPLELGVLDQTPAFADPFAFGVLRHGVLVCIRRPLEIGVLDQTLVSADPLVLGVIEQTPVSADPLELGVLEQTSPLKF